MISLQQNESLLASYSTYQQWETLWMDLAGQTNRTQGVLAPGEGVRSRDTLKNPLICTST